MGNKDKSAVIIIRFNNSQRTMVNLLERKIQQMKDHLHNVEILRENDVIKRVVGNTFEALELVNGEVYDSLRDESKKVLITLTDGMHRDLAIWSDQILSEARQKYRPMIAIGLGSDVDEQTLASFASHEDKIFVDVTASRLNEITNAVLAEVEFELDEGDVFF